MNNYWQEHVTTFLTAMMLSILVSWGAVYGLNLYLGPIEDPAETMGMSRSLLNFGGAGCRVEHYAAAA